MVCTYCVYVVCKTCCYRWDTGKGRVNSVDVIREINYMLEFFFFK